MKRFTQLVVLFYFSLSALNTTAQISITSLGSAHTENFAGMSASSCPCSAMPANWIFTEGGSNANTTYPANAGTSGTGDTYNFWSGTGSDFSIGSVQSGTLNSRYGVRFTNNTGSTITTLDISYKGEFWRCGATGTNDQLDFAYSLNATNLTAGTWVDVNNLDFTDAGLAASCKSTVGGKDGNATCFKNISYSITGLSIANGSSFYLRWVDTDVTGTENGLGIDDFSLTANGAACTAPTANATLITFGNILTTSVRVTGFTAPAGGADGYVVKMNSSNSFTALADGSNPTVDDSWNAAGEQVVYNGTSIPSTLDITGLSASTTYYFKVYSYKCAGRLYNDTETVNSNPDDVTTSAPTCTAPTLSTSITQANITTTAIDLTANLTDIGTNGATSVTVRGIEYSVNSDLSASATSQNTTPTGSTGTYTRPLASLTANTQYYHRAYATNDCSTPLTGYSHTSSYPTFITYPDAPTGLGAGSASTTGFSISWTQVSGTIEVYEVQVFSNAGMTTQVGSTYTTAANATSQVVSGLTGSTPYWYRVRATNNGGTQQSAWVNGPSSITTSAAPLWINPITGTDPGQTSPYTTGQTVGSLNVTVSGIVRGSGLTGNVGNDRYNATSWSTSGLNATDYFSFTLTPSPGFEIDFTDFVYTGQASGSGPTNFAFRSSTDGFTANIGTATVGGTTLSLSAAAYQDVTAAIEFRFYAWGGTGGTFSINDFMFNGSVTAVACNAPTANATAITFGNILTTSVRLTGFTAPAGGADGYVIKINDSNSFTNMTDGDNPSTDVSWNSAGEQVVYNSTTIPTTLDITGLTASSAYYFKVYAYKCVGRLYNNTETANSNPDDVTTAPLAPEISIVRTSNSANVADGSTYSFGSVNVGNGVSAQFTIQNLNTATANLTLTTPFTATGDFSILTQPGSSNLAPNASTTFEVGFTPSGSGLKSYSFSFANNDGDENPYNVTFEGTAVPACTAPNAVTNITLTPSSASVSGTIDAPSGRADGYLVVRNATATLSATPTSGNSYTAGNAFGTGIIVAFGSSASFNANGLNPNSTYYFFVFPYNNTSCFGGPTYNTTGYNENATTLNLSYQPFDNFDRADNNTVGEPSSLTGGGVNWTEVESSASSARVSSNVLLFERGTGGSDGLESASFNMSGKYPTVFSTATSTLQWYFSSRQTRPDPSGFNVNGYGNAFVLGATSADITQGNGYAVIVGNNNGTPFTANEGVHLIRYTGGLDLNSNITPVISWYTGDAFTGTLDYDNELSIKVDYNPLNNEWNLYVRDDGTFGGGLADPTTINGTHLRGTATDNTYTSSNLNQFLLYWHRASSTTDYAMFDNINIPLEVVSSPEIAVVYTTNNVNIADAGSVDFGPVKVTSGSYTMTYTITNIGTSPLTLGTISITGVNAADFTHTNPVSTTVAANASTTFTITFDPSASGPRTATFSMVTNDSDENPFNFTLNGEGTTPPVINEFVADHSGTDTNEFIEIFGANSTSYSNMTLLVIEGDESASLTVEGVINNLFTLGSTNATGYWWTGFLGTNQFQNGTSTMLLVMNFSGSLNQDLDTNDDGVLDITPWTRVVDAVALRDDASDKTYASPTIIAPNFDGVFLAPGGASRIPNGTDTDNVSDWMRNDVDGYGLTGFTGTVNANETKNTPNKSNTRFNVWLGTNTTWNDATNWTVRIPNDTTEALVPTISGGNYPVINTVATFDCFGLYLSSTASTITLGPGAEIRNHSNFQSNSGASTFGTGTISFVGNTASTISGTCTIGELAINNANGVTIQSGAVVNVTDVLILEAGQLTNSGSLNLKSTSTKTAYIDDFTGSYSGTLSGNVTLERFAPPTAGSNIFHYIGPVSSATAGAKWSDDFNMGITGSAGFITVLSCNPADPRTATTSNYGGLFSYHESNVTDCYLTGWKVENASHTVSPGRGIAARINNSVILDETGAYPNPVNNVTVTNLTKTSANTVNYSRGYNLIANPFYAPIDWTGVAADNAGNWDGTAYIYNSATGNYSTSNFLTSSLIIGTNQAFFVRANNAAAASTSLSFVFNESRRTTGNNGIFYRRPALYEYGVRIVIDNNGNTDNTLIAFDENFTENFDNGYDAAKLFNNVGVPSLYTKVGNDNQAILAIPLITDSTRTIPLSVLVTANGLHTMTFNLQDFPPTTIIWLEDLQAGVLQNLRNDTTYAFNGSTTDSTDRFLLHFTAPIVITGQDASCAGGDAAISVQHAGSDWVVTVEDSSGTVIATEAGNGSLTLIDSLPGGAYQILLTHDSTYNVNDSVILNSVRPVTAGFTASATSAQVDSVIQFSNSSTGATSYEWDFGDGTSIITTAAPTHIYADPGSYNVTLHASNTDCNAVTTVQIQVDQTFVITGEGATCAGGDAVISVEDADADWTITIENSSGTTVASETGSGAITQIDSLPAGVYTVLVTHSNSYQVRDTITLSSTQGVTADFTASVTNAYVDSLIQFTSNSNGATNYEWDFGDNSAIVTGVANPAHAYADTGTYTVTLRAANADCEDVATIQIVVERPVGIGNIRENNWSVAGHQGILYLKFDFAAVEDADVTISNLLGQQIFKGTVKTEGIKSVELTKTSDEQCLVVSISTPSKVFVKKVFNPSSQ